MNEMANEIELFGSCSVAKMFDTPHGIFIAQIDRGQDGLYCIRASLVYGQEIEKFAINMLNDTKEQSYLNNLDFIDSLNPTIVEHILLELFLVKPRNENLDAINGEQP